jgi:RNase P subunit RPR2
MKVTYKTKNERMQIEFDANTHKEIVKQLASFSEVFEEGTCKKCNSDNLKWSIRVSKDKKGKEFAYHELRCGDCGAKLPFGILDDGTDSLFPKRKDEEGNIRGKWGWVKWNPETEREE